MAETRRTAVALEVKGLDVYYGQSHALQKVGLTVESGVFSVVGRNGMGKSTLCKAIMGLVPARAGSVRILGEDVTGLSPAQIAHRGVGYVPQGRRLWQSLSVDEHLQLAATATRRGPWTVERVYDTFPRLAERKHHGGGQLSGGEQQMVAISRGLLTNPQLLIMDEPTEGLAPVIVAQLEEMLLRLADDGDISVLVIEQNIGVATAVSRNVAIMVNGRIERIIDATLLAADRDLQQRLLGVGVHAGLEAPAETTPSGTEPVPHRPRPEVGGAIRVYVSNPAPPTRWSQPTPIARIEAAARLLSSLPRGATGRRREGGLPQTSGPPVVLVVGTLDTKGTELRFIRDIVAASGLHTRLVDVSTSGRPATCDVSAQEIALVHGHGRSGAFGPDRGVAVAAMADAFTNWLRRQHNVAGIIAAGGSGATSLVAPAMRSLPIGIPKLIISSVASGDVGRYVGPSDITMMYSVTDVQGLNSISREVFANGANAIAGMVKARLSQRSAAPQRSQAGRSTPSNASRVTGGDARPAIGITMFGVTTPAVQNIAAQLHDEFECLVFHATGVGGRSMEKLVDSGQLLGAIDLTTTEVCDLIMGGVFPATEDRFGAFIRGRVPYVGSAGALDMVNFGAPDTVPERYRGRSLRVHNPQVTLMRTTPEENQRMGRWIGDRLNLMNGPVRFFLPEGGVSALDAPGQPFWDPEADAALFHAIEETVRTTANRQIIRIDRNINDPAFASAIVGTLRSLLRPTGGRRRTAEVMHGRL